MIDKFNCEICKKESEVRCILLHLVKNFCPISYLVCMECQMSYMLQYFHSTNKEVEKWADWILTAKIN